MYLTRKICEVTNESSLINSLKNITNKYDESGFFTDKNFKLSKDIFSPGSYQITLILLEKLLLKQLLIMYIKL